MKEFRDIVFKQEEGCTLRMDIYVPESGEEKPPLIMWIHGGAWLEGVRGYALQDGQLKRGYALADIEYRLSWQAPFPAQIIDCKDALAFLKKNAEMYGYDGSRICVSGDSAGGHLSALLGTSVGNSAWEKENGDYSVQAVVDLYGPMTVGPGIHKERPYDPQCPEAKLLGCPDTYGKSKMLGAAANPITYIDGSQPPFLICHGNEDPVVPYEQSLLLRDALEKAGVPVYLYIAMGGGHGFTAGSFEAAVGEFLDYYLKGRKVGAGRPVPERWSGPPVLK